MQWKIEMHAHTSEVSPCALIPAEEVVQNHLGAGYRGLVITDHFNVRTLGEGGAGEKTERYLRGVQKAERAAAGTDLRLYLGAELQFSDGSPCEYLIYGLTPEMIPEMIPLLAAGPAALHAFTRDHGAALFQAHPFRRGQSPALPAHLDAIEIHNGNPRHQSRNDIAALFQAHNGLRAVSGSDYHQSDDIGRGGILTEQLPEDGAALARLLLQGAYRLIG